MTPIFQLLLHWAHDHFCPCQSRINDPWGCDDCGLINEARYEWCQDPSCKAIRDEH